MAFKVLEKLENPKKNLGPVLLKFFKIFIKELGGSGALPSYSLWIFKGFKTFQTLEKLKSLKSLKPLKLNLEHQLNFKGAGPFKIFKIFEIEGGPLLNYLNPSKDYKFNGGGVGEGAAISLKTLNSLNLNWGPHS